jgi:ribonuclease VapC
MTFVLDASAILRFTDKEAGADRIRALFHTASRGEVALLVNSVNWGEIVSVLCKRMALAQAKLLIGNLANLPFSIVSVDKDLAERAAMFKHDFNVPYADAFAGALAMQEKATLITADYDFKSVAKNLLKIEFLPQK